MSKYIFLSAIIAALMVLMVFTKVPADSFLVSHDEFFIIGKTEIKNLFNVYDRTDFGYSAVTSTLATFHDRVFYSAAYIFGDDINRIQQVFYFVKFFLLFVVSFISLIAFKICVSHNGTKDRLVIFLTTIWYCYNPFTLVYWHSQAFSLTALYTYSLAPLATGLFIKLLKNEADWFRVFALGVVLYFMSFGVYLFAALVFSWSVFCLAYVLFNRVGLRTILGSLLKLLVVGVPVIAVVSLFWADLRLGSDLALSSTGGDTAGQLKSGLLNQFFMRFSWALYTFWQPRNIYTFHQHFYFWWYEVAVLAFYGLVMFFASRMPRWLLIPSLVAVLSSFVMVKGDQNPFGFVYDFLLENLSFFRVFRSPDNKFSFPIVLFLTLILVAATQRRKWLYLLVPTLAVSMVWPIFSGEAFVGKDSKGSSTRYVNLTTEAREVANFLNASADEFAYVLPIPHTFFGHYVLSDGRLHIGQDLLAKIAKPPFVYINEHSGISKQNFQMLKRFQHNYNLSEVNSTPVKYFLLRKDLKDDEKEIDKFILKNSGLIPVFKNDTYVLISNPGYKPIDCSSNYQVLYHNRVILNSSRQCWYQNNPRNWKQTDVTASKFPAFINLFTEKKSVGGHSGRLLAYFYPQAWFELIVCWNFLFYLLAGFGGAYVMARRKHRNAMTLAN